MAGVQRSNLLETIGDCFHSNMEGIEGLDWLYVNSFGYLRFLHMGELDCNGNALPIPAPCCWRWVSRTKMSKLCATFVPPLKAWGRLGTKAWASRPASFFQGSRMCCPRPTSSTLMRKMEWAPISLIRLVRL